GGGLGPASRALCGISRQGTAHRGRRAAQVPLLGGRGETAERARGGRPPGRVPRRRTEKRGGRRRGGGPRRGGRGGLVDRSDEFADRGEANVRPLADQKVSAAGDRP